MLRISWGTIVVSTCVLVLASACGGEEEGGNDGANLAGTGAAGTLAAAAGTGMAGTAPAAGTAAAAGTGAAGTGAAGAAAAGTGVAGTAPAAGTGAAGTAAAAGTGAGGGTPLPNPMPDPTCYATGEMDGAFPQCLDCVCTPNAAGGCLEEVSNCQEGPDPMSNMLCAAVIACARANFCTGASCLTPCMAEIAAASAYVQADGVTTALQWASSTGTCTTMACPGSCGI